MEAPLHSESGEGLTHLTKPHSAPLFRGCLNWGLCFWRRSPSPSLALDSPSDNHMSKGEGTPTSGGIPSLDLCLPLHSNVGGEVRVGFGEARGCPPRSPPFLASGFVSCLKCNKPACSAVAEGVSLGRVSVAFVLSLEGFSGSWHRFLGTGGRIKAGLECPQPARPSPLGSGCVPLVLPLL